jgi:hypothetical protein
MSQVAPRTNNDKAALSHWIAGRGCAMTIGIVVAGVVVLLAMVGISAYGWVSLPSDARIPLHRGPGGWGNWQPKVTALITYPIGAAVVFAIVVIATSSGKSGKTAAGIIAPLAVLVIAVTEYLAVRAAIRNGSREV